MVQNYEEKRFDGIPINGDFLYFCKVNVKDMKFLKVIAIILMVSILFAGCKKEASDPVIKYDHDFVDLGLPSGTLWATYNVGASSPEEVGDYFAWGETSTKGIYDWKQYKYSEFENDEYKLNKYCTDSTCGVNGFVDNITELEVADDAVVANWGDGWRMPTKEEYDELYENTTSEWITINGVGGRLLTGSNGNSIFFPATGFRLDDGLICTNLGIYWSSTLQTQWQIASWSLHFDDTNSHVCGSYERSRGQVVRAVRKK